MDNVCRTCMRILDVNEPAVSINGTDLREKLLACHPEMHLDNVVDPKMCGTCSAALSLSFRFKGMCSEAEKTINNCIENKISDGEVTPLNKIDLLTIGRRELHDILMNDDANFVIAEEVEIESSMECFEPLHLLSDVASKVKDADINHLSNEDLEDNSILCNWEDVIVGTRIELDPQTARKAGIYIEDMEVVSICTDAKKNVPETEMSKSRVKTYIRHNITPVNCVDDNTKQQSPPKVVVETTPTVDLFDKAGTPSISPKVDTSRKSVHVTLNTELKKHRSCRKAKRSKLKRKFKHTTGDDDLIQALSMVTTVLEPAFKDDKFKPTEIPSNEKQSPNKIELNTKIPYSNTALNTNKIATNMKNSTNMVITSAVNSVKNTMKSPVKHEKSSTESTTKPPTNVSESFVKHNKNIIESSDNSNKKKESPNLIRTKAALKSTVNSLTAEHVEKAEISETVTRKMLTTHQEKGNSSVKKENDSPKKDSISVKKVNSPQKKENNSIDNSIKKALYKPEAISRTPYTPNKTLTVNGKSAMLLNKIDKTQLPPLKDMLEGSTIQTQPRKRSKALKNILSKSDMLDKKIQRQPPLTVVKTENEMDVVNSHKATRTQINQTKTFPDDSKLESENTCDNTVPVGTPHSELQSSNLFENQTVIGLENELNLPRLNRNIIVQFQKSTPVGTPIRTVENKISSQQHVLPNKQHSEVERLIKYEDNRVVETLNIECQSSNARVQQKNVKTKENNSEKHSASFKIKMRDLNNIKLTNNITSQHKTKNIMESNLEKNLITSEIKLQNGNERDLKKVIKPKQKTKSSNKTIAKDVPVSAKSPMPKSQSVANDVAKAIEKLLQTPEYQVLLQLQTGSEGSSSAESEVTQKLQELEVFVKNHKKPKKNIEHQSNVKHKLLEPESECVPLKKRPRFKTAKSPQVCKPFNKDLNLDLTEISDETESNNHPLDVTSNDEQNANFTLISDSKKEKASQLHPQFLNLQNVNVNQMSLNSIKHNVYKIDVQGDQQLQEKIKKRGKKRVSYAVRAIRRRKYIREAKLRGKIFYKCKAIDGRSLRRKQPLLTCEQCGKVFKHISNLSVHMRSHVYLKCFKCDLCGKAFTLERYLFLHTSLHFSAGENQCPDCKKYFSTSHVLKKHQRTHSGEKPFVCELCDRRFTQRINLETHIRIHTGIKDFVCYICNTAFGQKVHLAGHIRIHTGEKPYSCDLCPKSYSKRIVLRDHKALHVQKPYMCNCCHTLFKDEHRLERHLKRYKNKPQQICSGKVYNCGICNRYFMSKFSRDRHMRVHVKDLIEVPTKF